MQQMQEPSLFETNESAQSALQSNGTSKSVLNLGVSSAKNSLTFKKDDRQIVCQNSQNTFNSGLKTNDNFQNIFDIDFSKELKSEIAKNPNFKPMVAYNKQPFNTLIFTNFTSLDFNLFMCFCFVAKNKRNSSIKLTFDDLEFLIGKLDKNGKRQKIDKNSVRLFAQLNEFCEKAAKVIVKQVSDDCNSYKRLFDVIDIYKKEKIIVIRFNTLMVEALNNITRYFTEFELQQYCNLKSKYSKQLYLLLMDNLYTGKYKISKDELIRRFSLDDKKLLASESNFEKVVFNKSVINEIKLLFTEFNFTKDYLGNGKNNRKIIAYNFIYKK